VKPHDPFSLKQHRQQHSPDDCPCRLGSTAPGAASESFGVEIPEAVSESPPRCFDSCNRPLSATRCSISDTNRAANHRPWNPCHDPKAEGLLVKGLKLLIRVTLDPACGLWHVPGMCSSGEGPGVRVWVRAEHRDAGGCGGEAGPPNAGTAPMHSLQLQGCRAAAGWSSQAWQSELALRNFKETWVQHPCAAYSCKLSCSELHPRW